MARKKQAPEKNEDLADEAEGWEETVVEAEEKEDAIASRLRDWRDVERLRELKELRGLVDNDDGLEELFRVQPPPPPAPKPAKNNPKGDARQPAAVTGIKAAKTAAGTKPVKLKEPKPKKTPGRKEKRKAKIKARPKAKQKKSKAKPLKKKRR